jgi:hypothetical protein
MTKKLDETAVLNELREGSAFFRDARLASERKKTQPAPLPQKPKIKIEGKDLQTNRLTDSQTDRVTELQTNRVTDFADYEVPDYRQLKRVELRLTWEQDNFLNNLESIITRDMPEGERSDPKYKRITKNSIIRALVEYARRVNLRVDATKFKNEADLARAICDQIEKPTADSQTNRLTESVSDEVTE